MPVSSHGRRYREKCPTHLPAWGEFNARPVHAGDALGKACVTADEDQVEEE
jgi:hypothetical protein